MQNRECTASVRNRKGPNAPSTKARGENSQTFTHYLLCIVYITCITVH